MTTQRRPLMLVVNDDPGARYMISRILRTADWDCEEAKTAFEALSKVEELMPDVVILDVKLPDLLGYEVCKRIKDGEKTRGISVLQTSATFVTPEGKARGLDSGADAYLTQPFEAIELVAMVRSLLRLKRTEAEARRHAALLVEADKRKDEFLAMLGHELRNPLSAILTASALIDRGEMNASEARRFNQTIHRQAQNLARLVDDLLDVSRITQGKIHLALDVVDLRSVVDAVLKSHRSEADKRHHRLHVSLGERPMFVKADVTRLEQIIGNLFSNALKYTANGGHIHVTLGERASETGPNVVFRMRDTGIGIAKENLGSIWDLFVQVDSTLARTESGLGIGLTMVRRLVEMHGGKVEVHSEGTGKGTEFSFELPLLADAKTPAVQREAAATGGPFRILLVDDNVDSCELYQFAFQEHGHEVTCAHDGQEGIDRALAQPFDLAVVDIGLPTIDGYQVASTLRQQLGDACPYLIALTGYGRPEDKARALASGFDMHLVKPIDVATVETMFKRLGRDRANKRAS